MALRDPGIWNKRNWDGWLDSYKTPQDEGEALFTSSYFIATTRLFQTHPVVGLVGYFESVSQNKVHLTMFTFNVVSVTNMS